MVRKSAKRTNARRLRREPSVSKGRRDRDFISLPMASLRAIVRRGRLTKGERAGLETLLAIHELEHGGGKTHVVPPKFKTARAKKSGPVARKARRNPPRYRLKDILKGISKRNLHPEVRVGRPVGREVL